MLKAELVDKIDKVIAVIRQTKDFGGLCNRI